MNIPTDTRTNERLTAPITEPNHTNRRSAPKNMPLHFVLTILWAICHFAFFFIQQVAEILAPLLLIAGIIWKIIPSLINYAVNMTDSSDQQIKNMIGHSQDLIPSSITLAGHTFSASSMIFDGLLLIGLTALCATMTAFLGRRL